MNSRQRGTWASFFEIPVRKDIRWPDFVSLIKALDGSVTPGKGSHMKVELRGVKFNIVRPHPKAVLKAYQVRQIRSRLERLRINL